MGSNANIWVSLGLKTQNFSKGISKAKGELSGFQKVGAGLKGLFNPVTLGIGAIVAVGAAVADAVKIFTEFEKSGSKLKAVLGDKGTAGAMLILNDQAKALGASTAFTATEVSSLQTELAKLGFDPTEIKNMTGAVLDLAAASGTELAEAAANAGTIVNAFGLNSSQAAHVADVMALSFSSSALDMSKLSETMKTAAPIARATGVSLEQATAAAGKLADAGIDGSKAGTDLKNIFSELVKDGKPFSESLNDIAKRMDGAGSQAEKLAIAEELVGERAKGSLLVLVDQKDSLGDLTTAFENADGTAKEMANTMLDNVDGSLTKASSAYEGFVLSIEDGSGPISDATKGLIDQFTDVLSKITELNNSDFTFWNRGSMQINGQTLSLSKLNEKFLELTSNSKNIVQFQERANATMLNLNDQFKKGILTLDGYNKAKLKLQETIKNTKSRIEDEMKANHPLLVSQQKIIKAYNDATGSALKYNKASLGIVNAANQAKIDIAKLKDEYRNGTLTMDEYNDKMKDIVPSFKGISQGSIDAAEKARRLKLSIDDIAASKLFSGAEYRKAIEDAVQSLRDGLEPDKPLELKIPATAQIRITESDISASSGKIIKQSAIEIGVQAGEALSSSLTNAAKDGLVGLGDTIGNFMAGGSAEAKAKLADLQEQLKNVDAGSEEFKRIQAEIKKTREEMDSFGGGMANIGENLISGFSSLLKSFGEQMIQLGLGMLALKAALALGPLGAGLAIAGGVALIAIASSIKSQLSNASATGFAQGGLVFGETMGLVGEGRGTTRSNPEVIAPLDKLKNFIDGGNNGAGEVIFRIEGNALVGVLNRHNKSMKFSS